MTVVQLCGGKSVGELWGGGGLCGGAACELLWPSGVGDYV